MRRLLIAAPIVLVSAAGAAAAWHYLRPHDPLAEANDLAHRGDLRGAQLVLRNAVQADPGRASLHLGLGQIQLRLGQAAAAEHELRAAAAHGTNDQTLRPLMAQALVAQGHNEEVLKDYTADGLPPDSAATVLVARAQAQLALGHHQDAAASIAQARQLQPKSFDAALTATQIAMTAKDWPQAATQIEDALAIEPHNLRALTLRAQIQALNGKPAEAVASYGEAIDQAQKSGDPDAAALPHLARAGLRAETGDAAGARADVDAVLKDHPKWTPALFASAQLYIRAADWRAADAALTAIGPVLSDLPRGDLTLAVVKANVGQPEQAIAAAERQVGHTPKDLAALKMLTRLDLAQHQPGRAAQVLTTARDTGVTLDPEALDLLSMAYSTAGQTGQAMGALQQAVASKPEDAGPARLVATEPHADNAPSTEKTLGHAQPMGTANAQSTGQAAAALVSAALKAGNIDQAAAALDRLRDAKGNPGEVALLEGMVKLAQIDLAGAQQAFQQVVTFSPQSVFAQISLARVLGMEGQTEAAAARLSSILANDHGNADALNTLVALRLAAGQQDKAQAAAEAANQAVPGNVGIVRVLARLYLLTNQPQKALTVLDSAAGTATPTNRLDVLLRVQAQLALKQRDAAVHTLRTALNQNPDDVGLRREMAELLSTSGDNDGALALLREGLVRRPGDPALLAGMVDVTNRASGVDATLARLDELASDPANRAAPMLKGDFLLAQKRFPDAIATYEKLASSVPSDDPRAEAAELRVAQALGASGQEDQAANRLSNWLTTHPNDTQAGLMLASLDITAKRLPEARLRLEAVLASQPNNGAALNNLAWICQQQGDLTQARGYASRAYLLLPSPQSADTLGWILLAQDQVPGAVALLREASNGQPNDAGIRYHLAAALARGGQKAQAVTLLKALLDQSTPPAFSEKPQAVKLLSDLST